MRFALQVGLTLKRGQRTLELVRELEDGHYVLEDVITRRPVEYTRNRLVNEIYKRQLLLIVGENPDTQGTALVGQLAVLDISLLNERERDQLEYRLKFVKALSRHRVSRGQRAKIEKVIDATVGTEERPSATTVMMWARKYQTSGMNPLVLVDRHRLRRTPRRLSENVEKILWTVLKRSYFNSDRRTLRFAYEDLNRELKRARERNAISPDEASVAYATLQRRVKSVDLYQRVASREGIARARMVCRTAFPDGIASEAMQNVQIDHTPLNWVVICDRTGLPLGRPLLTIAICAYSGYIVGFYLSFYGPGLTSVCGVIRSVISIKDDIVTDAGLKHPWISHGLPDELVVDNGLEFHSFGFKTMALNLGCDITYCRVRTPWLKPHVERFFSTLNFLTLTKGRITKTIANVMRIDPYKDAAITFSSLVHGLLMFFIDVHAFEPNWRKMATPFDLFSESISRTPPVSFSMNFDQLKLATGMSKELTLRQGGIEMLGLPYGSVDFKDIVNKHGHGLKLLCKWDPDDISTLYVRNPNGLTWHKAECRWKTYAEGLSFNQHRLIREFGRRDLKSPEREESLLDSRLALHNHWLDATSKRSRADALKAGRYQDLTSHKVLGGTKTDLTAPSPTRVLADAELRMADVVIPNFESFSFT
ncbi:transposase [Paracidovorax avenae]|uniref:DDE-type integrase/transposase/recombinase n=1 Tax=Paracidovorax avenae TaxID=80867 RepID=UPI000D22A92E|nr:DDE-type integrase/transposase/recombinase [Paracidovorax avenae]AVS85864.1 transposase [Paracidovorax avenae]